MSQTYGTAAHPAHPFARRELAMEAYLSRKETADYLGVTTKTVDRYIADGRLAAVRLGPRMVRIPTASIEALLTEAV